MAFMDFYTHRNEMLQEHARQQRNASKLRLEMPEIEFVEFNRAYNNAAMRLRDADAVCAFMRKQYGVYENIVVA